MPPFVGAGVLMLAQLFFSAASADEWTPPPPHNPLPAYREVIGQENGAACLDGTPPTYYVMPGDARRFYFHMEGGGWCVSLADCAKRSTAGTGSSKGDGPTTDFAGMVTGWGGWYLSNDTAINPMMATWTKVLVSYCDGASWAGMNTSTTVFEGKELYFRGKANLEGLLASMKSKYALAAATDVVVSGGSAGGLSTYLHADAVRAALPLATKVVAMPDAGFFIDNDISRASGWVAQLQWVAMAQNVSASLSPDCLAVYPGAAESWKCFLAQYAAPFIKTPLFVLQSQYDAYQTSAEMKPAGAISDPGRVNSYAANLTATLESTILRNPRNGGFLDACWHHSGAWPSLKIDGTTAWDAMKAWYEGLDRDDSLGSGRQHYWKQHAPVGFPCLDCCPSPCKEHGGCTSCCGPLW